MILKTPHKTDGTTTANLGGDLCLLGGGEDGERPLGGDAALRLGGVSPRRRIGGLGLRRGGESGNLLGSGDRLLGEANHIIDDNH